MASTYLIKNQTNTKGGNMNNLYLQLEHENNNTNYT